MSEEVQYQREVKAVAAKRDADARNQGQDDRAFALMIQYDMLDLD